MSTSDHEKTSDDLHMFEDMPRLLDTLRLVSREVLGPETRGSGSKPTLASPLKPSAQEFHSFLCLDVESTCIDTDTPKYSHLSPKEISNLRFSYPNEIIEWSVALLQWERSSDLERGEFRLAIVDTYDRFVRPTWNTEVTEYCHNLTGITQAHVDQAESFNEVLADFDQTFVKKHGLFTPSNKTIWVTDGPWDLRNHFPKTVFLSPALVPLPRYLRYPISVIDLRRALPFLFKLLSIPLPDPHRLPLAKSLSLLGLELEGRPHSGKDDPRNVGRCLVEMVNKFEAEKQKRARLARQSRRGRGQGRGKAISVGGRMRSDRLWWTLKGTLLLQEGQKYDWMGEDGQCTWTDPVAQPDPPATPASTPPSP